MPHGPSRVRRSTPAGREGARLEWHGRSWRRDTAAPGPAIGTHAVTTVERCGDADEFRPSARLIEGDCLDVSCALAREGLQGKVDLVYLDPPFASQTAYTYEARLDGPADGRTLRAQAYSDRWVGDGIASYLDMLAPRLEALCRLLAPTATIWVHVDYRASYLVRLLLDELLGRDAFVNEIVWRRAPNLGRQAASAQFGRTLDTLVVYGGERAVLVPPVRLEPVAAAAVRWDPAGRPFTAAPRGDYTDDSLARLHKEGRVHRSTSGKAYVKYFLVKNAKGEWCRPRRVDALWTDVAPLRHARAAERTGFPTQKPRALLDRIVQCASPAGGLVVDLFAGSGTTGESAHALGRRFVLGDVAPLSLSTARARLLRVGAPLVYQRCGPERSTPAESPRVAVERRAELLHVRLLAPAEPVAWAIDVGADARRPFRTVWHSERAPGARTRAATPEALVAASEGPVAVRVWHDDGRVGSCLVQPP